MKRKAQRLAGSISAGMAVAAMLAGGALADRPDDRAGMLGVGGASVSEQTVHPNDRAGALGVGGALQAAVPVNRAVLPDSALVRPDDRGGIRGPAMAAASSVATTTVSGDSFRWGDAAFGALAAFGFLLLTGATMVMLRGRSRVLVP